MSKGLEASKELREIGQDYIHKATFNELCDTIDKELKALESIKKHLFVQYSEKIQMYILCQWIDKTSWRVIQALSKEECEIWKEVLKNESNND